jgi:hypothetical protein
MIVLAVTPLLAVLIVLALAVLEAESTLRDHENGTRNA